MDDVNEYTGDILVDDHEQEENPVIIPGNTLYIKLVVMVVMLEESKIIICLYVGREKYEDLAKVGQLFQNQLFDLKNNGIIDQDGIHWPTELFVLLEIGNSCI
ncbi:unnamed protein product [Rhizophagus irregularis]|nr:unnamed protein product [Rhizophagus irregularis]